VLGRIAAGLPIEAIPDETEIDLSEFLHGAEPFVLRVDGESMIEAGILHGDMVIVESPSSARNGEMVVALIDNQEATLKTFLRNPDGSIPCRRRTAAWRRCVRLPSASPFRVSWSGRCFLSVVFFIPVGPCRAPTL